jgi:hypothetical protein
MLSADEIGSTALRAPIEIIEPITRENALPVDPTHTVWVSGSDERSGVARIRLGEAAKTYSWVFATTNSASVNREETPKLISSPTGHWVRTLRTEMQQFQVRTETEISRLSSAVESLARAVAAIHHNVIDDDDYGSPLPVFDASHAAGTSDQDLTAALNCIADLEISWSPEWAAIAQEKLTATSPTLRAASARAIAAHDSDLAISLLPACMEAEPNKFVRSVLRSALAAASA